MQKILLIEDSPDCQVLVKQALESKSYQVVVAGSSKEALDLLEHQDIELILLDILIPGMDGFKLCAKLQDEEKTSDIPVFFLSSKEDVSDKMTAFSLGADDYIVKPFDVLELRARVHAKLRKIKMREASSDLSRKGDLILRVDFQRAFLAAEGQEEDLNLTPSEFKILSFLAKNEGRVFSREQLLGSLWGVNVHVFDRTIDAHVCSLRRKLRHASAYVQSVPGVGYRFSMEMEARREVQ